MCETNVVWRHVQYKNLWRVDFGFFLNLYFIVEGHSEQEHIWLNLWRRSGKFIFAPTEECNRPDTERIPRYVVVIVYFSFLSLETTDFSDFLIYVCAIKSNDWELVMMWWWTRWFTWIWLKTIGYDTVYDKPLNY